ncbi:MAG: trypsin-like peptidase domain-containing protein [Gaiellales bacterium]
MVEDPPVNRYRSEHGRHLVRRGLPLVVAGGIGAGIVLGVGAVTGFGGEQSTIIRQVTVEAEAAQNAVLADTANGELSTQEIYRRAAPGVVRITSIADGQASAPDGSNSALGSGFVIDKAGHIVTNYHVVADAQEVFVQFSSEESVKAQIVGSDPSTDIAVLRVDEHSMALTPLTLGESERVQVGDRAIAIGNPFGLDRTVTEGIVSALQRDITAPDGFTIDHVIQTDAAINHGNSGGPLLDAQGRVIGVNAQIQSGGVDGNVGVGFAIPIDTVKGVVAELIASGKVEHAYLGVSMNTITPDLIENVTLPVDAGVLVAEVQPGSPAARAGLRGGDNPVTVNGVDYVLGGDVITAADGAPVTSLEQLRDIVLGKKPGDTLDLEVIRDGQDLTISVELGTRPSTATG